MCKKQTLVSHSSTESEILSLDAGLRMEGLPALDLWDVVINVLHSSNNVPPTQKISAPNNKPKGAAGNCRHNAQNTTLKKEGDRNVNQLSNPDHVATNAQSSQGKAQLYIFEDNEAVMMLRHGSRTHRVALEIVV